MSRLRGRSIPASLLEYIDEPEIWTDSLTDGLVAHQLAIGDLQSDIDENAYALRFKPGYTYSSVILYGGGTSTSVQANRLYCTPIWVPKGGITIKMIGWRVTTGAVGAMRAGIAGCDQSTGFPANLLDEWTVASQLITDNAGSKSINLASPGPAPHYSRSGDAYPFLWLCSVLDSTPSGIVFGAERSMSPPLGGFPSNDSYPGNSGGALTRNYTYGALPDPIGSVLQTYVNAPAIWVELG